jgi:hypothetical protein
LSKIAGRQAENQPPTHCQERKKECVAADRFRQRRRQVSSHSQRDDADQQRQVETAMVMNLV